MIRRHFIQNLLSAGLPLLVAIVTIPYLISSLGSARFGFLTLIWAIVSYLGLFDLGMGRAITLLVSQSLAQEKGSDLAPIMGTGLSLLVALGVGAGALMGTGAEFGVSKIASVPNRSEAVVAVYWLALSIPAIVLSTGFRGLLEARSQFGVLNLIRLPLGVFTFLAPALCLWLGYNRLDVIAFVLVAGRFAACFVSGIAAMRGLPWRSLQYSSVVARSLLTTGGWITVSNVVSPLMGYLDRFVIGVSLGVTSVAYFVTPQEIATKLWIIPGAFTSVLFPRFAAQAVRERSDNQELFTSAVSTVFCLLLPACAVLSIFSQQIISIWIDPQFAVNSYPLLAIFALGILGNSLAHIPYAFLQASGNSKSVGSLHLLELPFYVLALLILSRHWGLMGAGFAWLLRILLDSASLFFLSWSKGAFTIRALSGVMVAVYASTAVALLLALATPNFIMKAIVAGMICIVYGALAVRQWTYYANNHKD